MNSPIISGSLVNNSVIDTSYANRISGFLSNADNLCGQYSLRKPINFGQNISSTCSIKVDWKSFNCTCLTSILFNRLNAYYVPSGYVSKVGNISDLNANNGNWLKIYRDKLTKPLQSCYNSSNDLICLNDQIDMCFNIPSGINVWFMYADVGKSDGFPIYQILSVYVR